MKIAGMPILNFIPYGIWFVGKNQGAWGWFPEFLIAIAISGLIHYLN